VSDSPSGQRACLERWRRGHTLKTRLLFSFVIIGGKSVLSLGQKERSIHGGGRFGSSVRVGCPFLSNTGNANTDPP